MVERLEFVRKVGSSGRISLPIYLRDQLQGKIVRVIIEVIDGKKSA